MEGGYSAKPGMTHGDMAVVEQHKMTAKQLKGRWVHCHSVYGIHEGVLYKAMSHGIILINHTQLASADGRNVGATIDTYQQNEDGVDAEHVQFLPFMGPGLFLPYPGIVGIVPRPFFFI